MPGIRRAPNAFLRVSLKPLIGSGARAKSGLPLIETFMTIAYDKPLLPRKRRPASSRMFLSRLRQLLHDLFAAAVARRKRRAAVLALRYLSERDLKDMGLTRAEIGPSLEEAAQRRSHLQTLALTNGLVAGSDLRG